MYVIFDVIVHSMYVKTFGEFPLFLKRGNVFKKEFPKIFSLCTGPLPGYNK